MSFLRTAAGRAALACLALLVAFSSDASAAGPAFVAPSRTDKCPVCGMFVARYPDWVAEIVFKDGSYAAFDGAKDLFKFYFDMKRYGSKRTAADVAAVFVKNYYDLEPIDALAAFYVVGSDVTGPMGAELIPFRSEADAQAFRKDHRGKAVLRFSEVRAELSRMGE